MGLENYLSKKDILGTNWDKFKNLKEKLEKEGMSENIAVYRASELLSSERLEKIKLKANKRGISKKAITFFFKNENEIELVSKYFKPVISEREVQIGNSNLLIEFLKLMEEFNDKKIT